MKRKIIATIFIFLVVIAASGTMLSQYPQVLEKADKYNEYYYSNALSRTLLASNYAINYNLQNDTDSKTPSQIYIGNREGVSESADPSFQTSSNLSKSLDTTVYQWNETLKNNCQNLIYYAIDTSTNQEVISQPHTDSAVSTGVDTAISSGKNLKSYVSEIGDVGLTNKDENGSYEYQWVVTLSYDEAGILTVKNQSDSKEALTDTMIRMEQDYFLAESFPSFFATATIEENPTDTNNTTEQDIAILQSNYQFNGIKNKTFVYALPKTFVFYDDIANILGYYDSDYYWSQSALVLLSVLVAVMLLALFIPQRLLTESPIAITFHKIPLDFLAIFWGFMPFILIGGTISLIPLTKVEQSVLIFGTENLFFAYALNFLFLAFIYLVALLSVVSIKHAMSLGWRNFFKQTFVYKCLHGIKSLTNKFFHYLDTIDLKDSSNLKLIGVVLANFFLLLIMVTKTAFGLFFAIAYSIILLVIVRKYIDKVSRNYRDLLDVTKNIAEGNLDKEVNQDLGIFNSFKEDIINIRYSFKNAIEEEVKSQKMKTELISNVSHDLKTPLTSIITYTDLLKREGVSETERKSYLETLERNESRLKHLIEDLFEVSKVNSGNVQLNLQQVDIVSLMSQVLIEHEENLKQLGLSIRTNYSDEKILLDLDSQKTYRILANLIMNISKYAMPNSRVYIEVTDYGEQVELSFKNMSANEIDFDPSDIVERFARGDKSRNTEGSGLGLAISKSFTELQGGSFRIYVDGDLFKAVMRFTKQQV